MVTAAPSIADNSSGQAWLLGELHVATVRWRPDMEAARRWRRASTEEGAKCQASSGDADVRLPADAVSRVVQAAKSRASTPVLWRTTAPDKVGDSLKP